MTTKLRIVFFLSTLVLAPEGIVQKGYSEEAKPLPERVMAAPTIPDSFDERYSDKGELHTDLGPAKYQDVIAKHDKMTLTLRRFMVAPKAWELKSPKKMLDDARDHMLEGDKAPRLESEKDFTVDGFPGRSFLFVHDEDKTVSRMDWFLLKPYAYIHVYSGPKAGLESPDVKAFFKGIKTMVPEPKTKPKAE